MKKSLLLTLVVSIFCLSSVVAQDTIAAWTFPNTSADENVDIANIENSSRYISAEDSNRNDFDVIEYTFDGAEVPSIADDKCAAVDNWINGSHSKGWVIKIKTPDVYNVNVKAIQMSDENGPKDFAVQWRFSGDDWNNLDTVTLSDSWVVNTDVNLPASCDNSTSSIYVRWLMISNDDLSGGIVDSVSYSFIDNIVITGDDYTAVEDIDYNTEVNVYPNPSNGQINLNSTQNIENVQIFNISGKMVYQNNNVENTTAINLDVEAGMYFMQINLTEGNTITRKLIVR